MKLTQVLGLVGLWVLGAGAAAQEFTIKFATIAPEGSTWMNVMKEYDAAVRKESGGRLGFRIYPGGVHGEDKDVIRKIRVGQLHSAGFTGVGLGEIAPAVRILDAPFLFENYDEVDHVYAALEDEFNNAFLENGFVLLGWAEVGFVYVMTNSPVRGLSDMNGVKMWMWEGDQVAEATFKAFGIKPIPLSVVDVLTSLQTGLINGAYASPYAAVALQWHTRVRYLMNVPLADAAGAVVVTKRLYDSMPPDLQDMLVRNGRKYMRELTRKSRQENTDAIRTLKQNNVQVVEVTSPATLTEFKAAGAKARQFMVGRLYSRELLDRVEKALADFRAQRTSSK